MAKHRYDPDEAAAAGVINLICDRLKELGKEEQIRAEMSPDLRRRVDDAVRWHKRHQNR